MDLGIFVEKLNNFLSAVNRGEAFSCEFDEYSALVDLFCDARRNGLVRPGGMTARW